MSTGAFGWRRVGSHERVSVSSMRSAEHAQRELDLWLRQGKDVADVEVFELHWEDWGSSPGDIVGAP